MSIKQVVSVYDTAAQVFGQPFFVPSLAVAVRSVGDETNRAAADNPLYQHPEDFELMHVGTFDDASGKLLPCDVVDRVCRVKDLVSAKQG